MKFVFTYKNRKIFWRFIISYITILIITLSIGGIAYYQTLQLVKKDAIRSSLSVLEQSKQIMDTRLKEVESITRQLSIDSRVQSFVNAGLPLQDGDYEKIRDMQSKLPSYRLTNNFIYDTYIYFKNSETILSPNYTSTRTATLYNLLLKYEDMDVIQWKERITSKYYKGEFWPSKKVISDNVSQSMITYVQSIPMGAYNNPKGAIIVLIPEEEVRKNLEQLQISDKGWYYISDKDANIIASENAKHTKLQAENITFKTPADGEPLQGYREIIEDGQKLFMIYNRSSYNSWSYVAAIPSKVVFAKANYIRNLYVLTALLAFLIGLGIAAYMAYTNSRPLKDLMESNSCLKQKMEEQIPSLQSGFFERLFRGGFNRIQEIENIAASIQLDLKWDSYVVTVVRIEGYNNRVTPEIAEQLELTKIIIGNALKNHIAKKSYSHNIELDKIAILFGIPAENDANWQNALKSSIRAVIDECSDKYSIRLAAGIGSPCGNLADTKISYDEAITALEYKGADKSDIVSYGSIPKGVPGYFYPLDMEMRLMNITKMGDVKEVLNLLDLIYNKNFIEEKLSARMLNELIYEMRGTVIKLSESILREDPQKESILDEKLEKLEKSDSAEEINKLLRDIYVLLCEKVNDIKKSHNVDLKDNIIDFMNSNYMKEDFSLYIVASNFSLAENYLSQFFKEQTGETFSGYLEKIRMEQALNLLEDDKLSINDIVKQVGYSSPNTFYKAFKRIYGVSPSTHRRDNKIHG